MVVKIFKSFTCIITHLRSPPIRMGGERSELVEKRVAMCEDIFCMVVLIQ